MADVWPDTAAKYEPYASGDEDRDRWQNAFDDAFIARSLYWTDTDDGTIFTLRGSCPRCGHELAPIDVYFEVILGGTQVKQEPAITNILCSCDQPHDGRPDDRAGCGWSQILDVSLPHPSAARS